MPRNKPTLGWKVSTRTPRWWGGRGPTSSRPKGRPTGGDRAEEERQARRSPSSLTSSTSSSSTNESAASDQAQHAEKEEKRKRESHELTRNNRRKNAIKHRKNAPRGCRGGWRETLRQRPNAWKKDSGKNPYFRCSFGRCLVLDEKRSNPESVSLPLAGEEQN